MNHSAPDGKLRMLVVDDHVDSAESLRLLLELAGHEARAVYRAAEALEAARDFKPAIVFTDIQMPGMHGAELVRQFRQSPELAGAIVVATTATDRDDARLKGYAELFDDWLRKPFGWSAVEALVGRFAARARR